MSCHRQLLRSAHSTGARSEVRPAPAEMALMSDEPRWRAAALPPAWPPRALRITRVRPAHAAGALCCAAVSRVVIDIIRPFKATVQSVATMPPKHSYRQGLNRTQCLDRRHLVSGRRGRFANDQRHRQHHGLLLEGT